MRGLATKLLGLAAWQACTPLERIFGPSNGSGLMLVDTNDITQSVPVRAIDTVLEHNYDRAAVREEHAIHATVLNGFGAAAHDAQRAGRTDLATKYRKEAIELDKLAAIQMRTTAARTT